MEGLAGFCRSTRARFSGRGVVVFLGIVCLIVGALPSRAQLVLTSSSGSIRFATEPVGPAAPGPPVFAAPGTPGRFDYELITAGSLYPTLGLPAPVKPITAGPLAPGILFDFAPPTFPTFGGGVTSLFAFSTGASAGIDWTAYSVGDFAPVKGTASTNVSNGKASFKNGPVSLPGLAGMFFPVVGFMSKPSVGGAAGFVTAAAAATITITAPGLPVEEVDPFVVIANNGFAGPRPNFAAAGLMTPFPGGSFSFAKTKTFPGGLFFGYGVVLCPVIVPAGAVVSMDATVSLAADPDAMVQFGEIPPDELQPNVRLPDFGPIGAAAVPEPGSPALLTGLLALSAVLLCRRRKTSR